MPLTTINSKTHVLVTGGAGFIGSHLSARFLSAGARVTILTRHVHAPRADQLVKQGATVVACDLSTDDGLSNLETLPVAHIFCHLAADVSVSSPTLRAANVEGTRRALQLASTLKVPYFVSASSIEAQGLGSHQEIPLREECPCRPESEYGRSKAEAEKIVSAWRNPPARDTLTLRIGNVYGPGSAWLLEPALSAWLDRRPLLSVWDRLQHRIIQPLYIDDLIEGIVRAVQARLTGLYNITGEEPVSIGAYMRTLGNVAGFDTPFGCDKMPLPARSAPSSIAPDFAYLLMGSPERCHRAYDNAKLRAQIGPYTSWSLLRGLASTLQWYHQSGSLTALCRASRKEGTICMSH
ncbi:MAG TPA: NAD(P)-dependent oxidoreductase [Nitrospiraceae bacterium]|nr:NAD(P)-dependent oxidoreductase [Nitrospiraceae bacterium]